MLRRLHPVLAAVALVSWSLMADAARGPGDEGDWLSMQSVGQHSAAASGDRVLLRRGPRKFVWVDWHPINEKSSCRLHTYTPSRLVSPGAGVLCSGGEEECVEPCQAGYERTATGACQQVCPPGSGFEQECYTTKTCVRKGMTCPNMAVDVPFECPSPATLMATCAKQQYRAKELKLASWLCSMQVKAFDGRWLCVDKAVYEPCGDGFTNSSSVCTQTCPPGWLDCKDRCSMPGLGCDVGAHPAFLCPLVGQQAAAAGAYRLAQETGSAQAEDAAAAPAQSDDCDLETRTAQALQTACLAAGVSRTAGSCPMTLTMQGGCGGGRLQVSSGLRTQGIVDSIEAWWDTGIDAILALRIKYSRGVEQVLGNHTRAAVSEPNAQLVLGSEFVTSVRMWRSRRAADGAHMSPVLARIELTTSKHRRFVAGDALPPLPNAQRSDDWSNHNPDVMAQLEKLAQLREDREAAIQQDPTGSTVSDQRIPAAVMPARTLALDTEGSVLVSRGHGLGSGIAVGAAAYSSQSAVTAFGLLFLDRLPSTEL